MTRGEADFLVAAETVRHLLGRVEVAQRWDQPSALEQMSVGALAAHLVDQVLVPRAAVVAGESVTDESTVPLLEHYSRVPWVGADLDDDSNVAIRQRSAESATPGHGALVVTLDEAVADLRQAFASSALVRPAAIRLPVWDWALSFEDYLVTRVMEIVVHSDDLAVSVEVDPPELPHGALGQVLALLVGVSLQRHGQAAVVRALSRSERAGPISAF